MRTRWVAVDEAGQVDLSDCSVSVEQKHDNDLGTDYVLATATITTSRKNVSRDITISLTVERQGIFTFSGRQVLASSINEEGILTMKFSGVFSGQRNDYRIPLELTRSSTYSEDFNDDGTMKTSASISCSPQFSMNIGGDCNFYIKKPQSAIYEQVYMTVSKLNYSDEELKITATGWHES